jgi:hypothetical protein
MAAHDWLETRATNLREIHFFSLGVVRPRISPHFNPAEHDTDGDDAPHGGLHGTRHARRAD